MLEDHYGANINRIAIAKGNAGQFTYINEFVEEAKASASCSVPLIAQAQLERGGACGGPN